MKPEKPVRQAGAKSLAICRELHAMMPDRLARIAREIGVVLNKKSKPC